MYHNIFSLFSPRDDVPTPTHQTKKYLVYESSLMELFSVCPVCTWACDVKTSQMGTFLSVEQQCTHCEHRRRWNSQPLLGSTPAGNLHLSAAVYLSGASFVKIEKVNDEKFKLSLTVVLTMKFTSDQVTYNVFFF